MQKARPGSKSIILNKYGHFFPDNIWSDASEKIQCYDRMLTFHALQLCSSLDTSYFNLGISLKY